MDAKEGEPTPEELAAYLDFLRHSAQQRAQQAESELVYPTPSFVVKTALLTLPGAGERPLAALPAGLAPGQKVFVNITHHASLPPISTRPGEAAVGSGGDGGVAAALSVPLAMGEPRLDRDKAGAAALAVDVIVHPSVTADAERDGSGHFRHWLVDFCLQYFARKFGAALSPQYRVPLMAYKGGVEGGEQGGVHPQRLRKPKAAVIGEGGGGGGGGAAGSGSGSDAALKPMSLLAEAGALPEAATGLVVSVGPGSSSGASTSASASASGRRAAPRGPPRSLAAPGTAGGGSAMEIRLVGEERAREAMSFASRVAEEVGAEEGGKAGEEAGAASGAPALIRQALGGPAAAPSSASGIGLSQGTTRRLPRARTVQARVEVELARAASAGDGAAPEVLACPVQQAPAVQGEGKGSTQAFACALPPKAAGAASDSSSSVACVRIELSLSLPVPPLSALSLCGAADGTSLTLRVAAHGDAPALAATLALPVPCSLVTSSSSGSGGSGGGASPRDDGQAVASVQARYLGVEGVVLLALPCLLASAPPPLPRPLPPRGEALAALLARHVDFGGVARYEPDVGSRQWLVAQAWAVEGAGAGAAAPGGAAPPPPAGGSGAAEQEDALPEDRFHAQDALSMHYVRQREEEGAKKLQKEAEKERERLAEERQAQAAGRPAPALDPKLYTDLL